MDPLSFTSNDRVPVEDSPYERGNAYQTEIDERNEATLQGLSLSQSVNTETRELEVRLFKNSTVPVSNARVIASFVKASESKQDMQRELIHSKNGVYLTSIVDASGFYLVKYLVIYNGKRIRFEDKVTF